MAEGLRERKKRQTRQQISDTATALFFERGFDAVRVVDVAAACGVSEKTVYNYFPTKESLLLDREAHLSDMLREALGPAAPIASPIEAVKQAFIAEIGAFFDRPGTAGGDFRQVLRLAEVIESSPSLRAAQRDMMDRLAQVAAEAMARRAGLDPLDPAPQIAANAITGLWAVAFRALRREAETATDAAGARAAVVADIEQAASLLETGLWSFALLVQGQDDPDHLAGAARACDRSREHVLTRMRRARDAWAGARQADAPGSSGR
ncbi:TetR/AcrR family transcriptional regulator [Actinoallomurus sp. CA-150999]|uniref:TetR/AcrR family transcriptional regulator n=1 Tax=Actinoallomurus sp. CA-150999 TaxID=3239887 RepID=UPI003D910B06